MKQEDIKVVDKLLRELGFKKDLENGYIWTYEYHYIRVYIDPYFHTYLLNIRGSKFTRSFRDYSDYLKGITFIKKLQKRLIKDTK